MRIKERGYTCQRGHKDVRAVHEREKHRDGERRREKEGKIQKGGRGNKLGVS